MKPLYHLALAQDWSTSPESAYEVSTLGVTLEQQGFIHCSFDHQVQHIADMIYRGRSDVVLLKIDPARLVEQFRVEALETAMAYPHIYGPLNRDAVLSARPVPLLADGRLDIAAVI